MRQEQRCTCFPVTIGGSRDVTGSGYQLSVSAANAMNLSGQYIVIEGIDVKTSDTTGTNRCISVPGAIPGLTIRDCIFHDSLSSAGTNYQLFFNNASAVVTMSNTICYGNHRNVDARNATCDFDHCTFYGGALLGVLADSGSNFYNCYSGGHGS